MWTRVERALLAGLDRPIAIQRWLNRIAYDPEYATSSPRLVIRERKANCFEGALFAAAALRELGHRPRLVDIRSWNDDDHVIAVFEERGHWGAVAKSNFTVLRFREPVYRSVRELVMSYFDVYFNAIGQKTMRSFSGPLDLGRFDRRAWATADEDLGYIGDALDAAAHFRVLTPAMVRALNPSDSDLMRAGLMGSKRSGLFKPQK